MAEVAFARTLDSGERPRPGSPGGLSSLPGVSRTDRAIGISLGIVIGIVALILFVFLGSSESIDAPSLDAATTTEQTTTGATP